MMRRSATQIVIDHLIFTPTKRSRNRKKPTPAESDIVTFNYTAHLWDMR
ncbi:NinE family protein [Klebsiella oxytoca]|uniref:NinE family protein n=1 Tax=Klebsiella oxytoca TaxID=571 RepID=A0AAD3UQ27_KLEOX|nr:NinE family protein [Klebsiella oxytoca]ELT9979709.1 NinE family protein [Klebsiella oxytoca]MBL6084040.1 NinE family protein [Klebsiella oxytoca]MBL6248361.1 NinE family protein [Klebsiella oxytoca]MBL6270979.1 NinE family protein [Klebsiella oxytoca]